MNNVLPAHLGFILDGNRRWAASKGMPTLEGHRKGYDNLKEVAKACFDRGIQYVSAYIFSTENWSRSREEVGYLMDLALRIASRDTKELIKNNIKIVILGAQDRVPPKVAKAFADAERESSMNTGGTLALCFNYGGFREISDAVQAIVDNGDTVNKITPEVIEKYLYHPEIPPLDFIIRTSGEQRLSNFMLWRAAYAEMLFINKYWPAFTLKDLDSALKDFATRSRRFGGG